MTTWGNSDEHFFHRNIARYENRPNGWEELIILRHNELVAEDDIVIHFGDFCFASAERGKEMLDQMAGYHILVLGNHDKSIKWAMDIGFQEVYGNHRKGDDTFYMRWSDITSIHPCAETAKASQIVFSHAPLKVLPAGAILNFHGHVHSNPYEEVKQDWHRNLCLDANNLYPVKLSSLI